MKTDIVFYYIFQYNTNKQQITKEVDIMATKSFLKTVDIKDKSLGVSFVKALFECDNIPDSKVEYKSNPKELKGDAIKDFFDGYKKQHDNF